jgi:putative peptide zinc metalloprotease protein
VTVLRRLGGVLALVVLVLALLVSAAPTASAQEPNSGSSGSDSTAIALNTKDGSSLFKFAFSITKATGEVVDAGNAAVAYASCVECSTVAVAVQFVLVQGSPDIFTPENVAIAINEECNLCETMALAYQVVIQTDGPVRLTNDGRQQLHDLLKQLKDLEDGDLTLEQLHAKVEDLVDQMTQVLSTQLVPIGKPDDAAAAAASASTTTTVKDTATTTSTTEAVRSTTTTTRSGSTTTTTSSTPTSTTTTTTSTPSTTEP